MAHKETLGTQLTQSPRSGPLFAACWNSARVMTPSWLASSASKLAATNGEGLVEAVEV